MKTLSLAKTGLLLVLLLVCTSKVADAKKVSPFKPEHPAYLHALSNLRAARWMIEHHPGNWQQTKDEIEAVKRIDAAIDEIKKAAIDDGKNLKDRPDVKEVNDHIGRLRQALDYLSRARANVAKEEDNSFARGLKARALDHIDGAIRATEKAIRQ